LPVAPDRTARKIEIPTSLILDMLSQKGLVTRPVLREVRGDVRQGKIILHLDSETDGAESQPFEVPFDWKALFDSA
jgi:hypothetical protein